MTDLKHSSINWQPYVVKDRRQAWHASQIPYKTDANALQTVDIWLPARQIDDSLPTLDSITNPSRTWDIYIHGGAWRDPAITSASFNRTVQHLFCGKHAIDIDRLAGLASINYSLSPYPSHPTDPATFDGADQSRTAVHPQHVQDVISAIAFLQTLYGFGSDFALIGHSCGATLAFQTVMKHAAWYEGLDVTGFTPPRAIYAVNGLYDLAGLIEDAGPRHRQYSAAYAEFIHSAFASREESVLDEASPARHRRWSEEWEGGHTVILSQSVEDTLVPESQTAKMMECLESTVSKHVKLVREDCRGDHDEVWQNGAWLAELIARNVLAGD